MVNAKPVNVHRRKNTLGSRVPNPSRLPCACNNELQCCRLPRPGLKSRPALFCSRQSKPIEATGFCSRSMVWMARFKCRCLKPLTLHLGAPHHSPPAARKSHSKSLARGEVSPCWQQTKWRFARLLGLYPDVFGAARLRVHAGTFIDSMSVLVGVIPGEGLSNVLLLVGFFPGCLVLLLLNYSLADWNK